MLNRIRSCKKFMQKVGVNNSMICRGIFFFTITPPFLNFSGFLIKLPSLLDISHQDSIDCTVANSSLSTNIDQGNVLLKNLLYGRNYS